MRKRFVVIVLLCASGSLVAMTAEIPKKVKLRASDFKNIVLRPDPPLSFRPSFLRNTMCRSASLPTNLLIIAEEPLPDSVPASGCCGSKVVRGSVSHIGQKVFESEIMTAGEIAAVEREHVRSVSAPTSPSLPSAVVETNVVCVAITQGRLHKKSVSAPATPCAQHVQEARVLHDNMKTAPGKTWKEKILFCWPRKQGDDVKPFKD